MIDIENPPPLTDPAAVKDYVRQVRLHAMLQWRAGRVMPMEIKPASKHLPKRVVYAAILTLAASIAISIGLLFRGTDNSQPTVNPIAQSDGEIHRLESGEKTLSFKSGTTVKLLGPAELRVIDDMHVQLISGSLTAKLEPGGQSGFTVMTSSANVVDLSTEFSVSVANGETDVCVFEGAVDVTPTAIPQTTRLARGEAVRVAAAGKSSRIISMKRNSRKSQPDLFADVSDNAPSLESRKCYQIVRGGLNEGAFAYVDREYQWRSVPESLREADYVMTFNDDKRQTRFEMTLTLDRATRLFVFMDDRSPPPAWLAEAGFTPTDLKIMLHETGPEVSVRPFSVWQCRQISPGVVRLGSNAAKAMYVVVAVPEKIRVACLGDSITAGAGYVNELGQWLGNGYEVKNFGVSGATLLAKGDKPYTKEKAYADAIAFKPDIVTVMLGTNDTKPQNFKHIDSYIADYKSLLEPFLKQDPKPKIHLVMPVPVFFEGNFGIDGTRMREGIFPKVKALAEKLKLPLIDLHTPLEPRADLFSKDCVHPLGGVVELAAPIYTALTGKIPPVPVPPAPPKQIRIACLGDSITEGSGYPGALQQMLGNRFIVRNYGVSGCTLLSQGDKPYTKQSKFAAAKAFAPDAVIIMLGTNDSKPQNYKHIAAFAEELAALGKEMVPAKVLLALPVPVIGEGNFGIDNARLEEGVIPAIRKIAKEQDWPIIDTNTAMKGHEKLFKDRIHPVGAAQLMAKPAYDTVSVVYPMPARKGSILGTTWTTRGGVLKVADDVVTVSGRTAGFHGPAQEITAAVKSMGYYHLQGRLRLTADSADATLVIVITDSRGMRYLKTPSRGINAAGWTEFADHLFVGWTGELQKVTFTVETNGSKNPDLMLTDAVLIKLIP